MLGVVASSRVALRPAIAIITKTSVRNESFTRVVSGPPRVRISFAEKVAHGIVFFVACNIIPCVITANIPKYNQAESEEDD